MRRSRKKAKADSAGCQRRSVAAPPTQTPTQTPTASRPADAGRLGQPRPGSTEPLKHRYRLALARRGVAAATVGAAWRALPRVFGAVAGALTGLVVVWSCAGILAAQIAPPAAGWYAAANGDLRPVRGVPGALLAGGVRFSGALSAAFSDQAGMVKLADAIVITDGNGEEQVRFAAPGGPAILNPFDLVAYFPAGGMLWSYRGGAPRPLPFRVTGEIAAIAARQAVVRRDGALWLLDLDGEGGIAAARPAERTASLSSCGAGSTAAAFLDGVLAADCLWPDLPGPAAELTPMRSGWVHIRAGGRSYAARPGRPELLELPGAADPEPQP